MEREVATKLAQEYLDFYFGEWSDLRYQSQLDVGEQKQLLERRDQIERDSQLPIGRVGRIVKDLVTLEKGSEWVEQVTDLIVRRSTPIGRAVDNLQSYKEKILKIK
jgi:hypothetical protein